MGVKRRNETTEITKPCIELLHRHGCLAWRNNTGAMRIGTRFVRFGTVGLPDIIGVLPGGRFIAIECKREKGVLTDAQKEKLDQLIRAGAAVAVVNDPSEIDGLMEAWKC